MPYVIRNAAGEIESLHSSSPSSQAELLPPEHPELLAFVMGKQDGRMDSLDLDFIRVIEDVITLLVEKRVFRYTDLPEAVQQKLNQRRTTRQKESNLQVLTELEKPLF